MTMEFNKRKAVIDNLKKYCPLAKEHDSIEVCEWSNGEGYDINLNNTLIHLTIGELDAIKYLTDVLMYEDGKSKEF